MFIFNALSVLYEKYKRHRDYGFWDQGIRMSILNQLVDPLERLNEGVVLIYSETNLRKD